MPKSVVRVRDRRAAAVKDSGDGFLVRAPRLRGLYALIGLFLVGYLISLLARSGRHFVPWLDGWMVCGIELTASVMCLTRGFLDVRGRVTALVLGAALLSWSLGDVVITIQSLGGATPPSPSVADIFYLSFYPLAYTAVMLFIRSEVRGLSPANWLDGVIAGLGAAAVCAAFAFHSILSSSGRDVLGTITNLAYPIGDVLLLGLVVGGFAVLSGTKREPWALFAAGLSLNVLGDTSNLLQNSMGASKFGAILNGIAWPTSIVVMSMAVWLHDRRPHLLLPERQPGFVLPNVSAAAALVILFMASFHSPGRVAIALATATLAVVGARLAVSVRLMQKLSEERRQQSMTDELTGLRNRRYLFQVLDDFFARGEELREGHKLAFLFIDLDHFKEINDSFGHPAGDELLRQLAARLSTSLRESDLMVRIGGDEFAVVLIDGDSVYAEDVAQRVTDCLRKPFVLDVVSTTIGASIGIAMAPTDAGDAAGLMWCADVAMYRAKLGGAPFASYQQKLDDWDQMRLLEELRVALEQGGLTLHYQPQLDLRSREVPAVEALLRWEHPRLGLVPPVKFLPLVEEAGLMYEVTRWVVRTATEQCAAWRAEGRLLSVAVNVSPSNLIEPGFVELVRDELGRQSLPTDALVIEITETCVITDFERTRQVIEELREMSVVVSIDDFGAGVTSLAYLSRLPVRELKLDRYFVARLAGGEGERDLELLRSTIELGHAMGLRIVAEGIEDEDTLDLLAALGCDFAQGYCICRPKPAGELAIRPSSVATTAAL
jgi:diguanylate cyclase (GGDEF)-like protein